jgi:CDP-diacylglycerol---serine O-phosphatidyltransferase
MQQPPKWPFQHKIQRRGIYFLPNLFTTAALFAGFYAIVQAMNGKYENAAIGIFVAMIADGLDGRIARLTRTQSAFGAEYDSLSDMVSFGVAPALVIYVWALKGMGRWGWVAAFIYCVAAALRLARFNTQLDVADKRFFQGLPSPAAAALIAGLVWTMNDYNVKGLEVAWVAWGFAIFAGLSMVSDFKFYSFKDVNLRRAVPFWAVVAIALVLVAVMLSSDALPQLLLGLSLIYALSGYVVSATGLLRRKR